MYRNPPRGIKYGRVVKYDKECKMNLSEITPYAFYVGNTLTSQLSPSGFNSQKQLKCKMSVLF